MTDYQAKLDNELSEKSCNDCGHIHADLAGVCINCPCESVAAAPARPLASTTIERKQS